MPTLSISSEKVCYLIIKARAFDAQEGEQRSRLGFQCHR